MSRPADPDATPIVVVRVDETPGQIRTGSAHQPRHYAPDDRPPLVRDGNYQPRHAAKED